MAEKGSGKLLSVSDWEQLLQDFRTSHELQERWLKTWPGLTVVDQALHTITKREFPLKPQLFNFLEENAELLIGDDTVAGVGTVVESMRNVLQAFIDGVVVTNTLKEQMLVMTTTIAITVDALHTATSHFETLVEILLGFISRTNHASDRHVRASACECLRELEMAHPCLLHVCVGHVFSLCQSERTHAGQSYTLLLTAILHNMACHMYTIKSRSAGAQPFLSITVPLVPFSVPAFLTASISGQEALSVPARELTEGSLKEFRRAVAFLLERPQLLTEFGMLEFVAKLINIARALDLHGSLLKHQFSSFLYSYSAILCHVVLLIYSQFMEAFKGDEGAILKRLVCLCRESLQPLPVRLLGIHWLLGVESLHARKDGRSIIAPLAPGLYPLVFDPLSLKAAKLRALAECAASLSACSSPPPLPSAPKGSGAGLHQVLAMEEPPTDPASRLLNEGLLCVSAFTWLPSSSTETRLTFHSFHKFLTVAVPHGTQGSSLSDMPLFIHSQLFKTLQNILVVMALRLRDSVPSILALLDRLMGCNTHQALGKHLLRTFNKDLLSQLKPNWYLPAYFSLIERIAENADIPPGSLLELLTVYIRKRVEEHNGDADWKLWLQGNHVLGICRTVLMNHKSSRGFQGLTQLLTFLCRFFPDIEVRDTARLYLRLLISVPGNRLRDILSYGDERIEEAKVPKSSQVSSLLRSPSPPTSQAPKQSLPLQVGAYIRLTRENRLLVRLSWSLVLYNTFRTGVDGGYKDVSLGSKFSEVVVEELSDQTKEVSGQENGGKTGTLVVKMAMPGDVDKPETRVDPIPRVMDAKTSEVLEILRRHFEQIPDFRCNSGVKINVPCNLRFQGETRQRMQGETETSSDSPQSTGSFYSVPDSWPAIYAVVISFITTGLYGPIPSVHVPFLLSEPPQRKAWQRPATDSPTSTIREEFVRTRRADHQSTARKGKAKQSPETSPRHSDDGRDSQALVRDSLGKDGDLFNKTVVVELEPKQPVPTLVDARIVFSDEEGQSVQGQLDSIPVGIEDLFVKPPFPDGLPPQAEAEYYYSLFNALWEACSGPGRLGTETFSLKGGSQVGVHIEGSESVKLLEGQADRVVGAVEQWLASFVVAVSGGPLVSMARDGGMLEHVVWQDDDFSFAPSGGTSIKVRGWGSGSNVTEAGPHRRSGSGDEGSLRRLEYPRDGGEAGGSGTLGLEEGSKGGLGRFFVLIFLPPRYHLLLIMEVSDWSTLVRIRTDHWPCLAHVDEFLEALVMSR